MIPAGRYRIPVEGLPEWADAACVRVEADTVVQFHAPGGPGRWGQATGRWVAADPGPVVLALLAAVPAETLEGWREQ